MIHTVYTNAVSKGGNQKTDELKRLFSETAARKPVITECESKNPFADDGRIKAIYYDGEEYNGKPCKVFAYIGFPENASPASPVPAMVLVHGGMGHACAEWTRFWVNNGYAAISIDGFGQHPADGEYDGDNGHDGWTLNDKSHMTIDDLQSAGKPFHEQWFFYYISDIIAANNILRSDSRIKTDCIGLTGLSWGGFSSSVTMCYDSRFKFACPVYGCGFLEESTGIFSAIAKKDGVRNVWEPSLLLGEVKMPVMWICGDNDPFFSAEALTKSAYCAENGSLTLIPNYPHGQDRGALIPEIVRFANEQNSIGNGNIKIDNVTFKNGRGVLSLDIPQDIKNVSVYCYYRFSPLEYKIDKLLEEWKKIEANVSGDFAIADIPENAETVYFEAEGETEFMRKTTVLHASTGLFTAEQFRPVPPKMKSLDIKKLSDNLTETIKNDISSGKVGCAEILVNQAGKRIFDGVFGAKNSDGESLQKNAVFRLASMTKPVTAAALLIEADRGNLSIYDEVSKYLPEYKNMKIGKFADGKAVITSEAVNSLKLYQLVSHTSGIASGEVGAFVINQMPPKTMTTASVTEYLASQPLEFDPSTAQNYSTAAFDIAARIIEITSGMPFPEYLKINIFDKLGMKDTTFSPSAEQWERTVDMHNYSEESGASFKKGSTDCVFENYPVTYPCAGASLASTAEDYMKFAEMLLNDGKAPDGSNILSAEALKLMSTPHIPEKIMGGNQRWGLGVRIIVRDDHVLPVGSFGWSGAYGSHFWVDPVNKITAVYMKNSLYDGGAGCKTSIEFEKDVMKSFEGDIV